MTTTLAQLAPRLREYWVAPPTADAVSKAGPFCRLLKKGSHTSIGGGMYWESDGNGQLALRIGGSGNVGANRTNDIAQITRTENNVRYVPQAASWWGRFDMASDQLKILPADERSVVGGANKIMQQLLHVQRNWYRTTSAYYWRDGKAGVASLAAGSAVLTTITLANPSMTRAFEIGDVLVAYDPAVYAATAPGVVAVPRGAPALPGTDVVTITGRDDQAGTLTLSANFSSITGGAAGDIIGHFTARPIAGASVTAATLYGVNTYLSFTAADRAVTNALGVNRTVDPDRTSGYFRTLPLNTPPSGVLEELAQIASEFNLSIDTIYAQPRNWIDLSRERNAKTRYVRQNTMEFGATGVQIVLPNMPIDDNSDQPGSAMLVTDPYLWDLTTNNDLYVALYTGNWGHVTTTDGIHWDSLGRPAGENGLLSLDNTSVTANYGAVGNLATDDPSNAIVISVPRS